MTLILMLLSASVFAATPRDFVDAPIHSEAFSYKITLKTKWPAGRPKPSIASTTMRLAWTGETRSPKGHVFPTLYATVDVAIPAGAQLTTSTDKPLEVTPRVKNPATDLDLFAVNLPITRLDENEAHFYVKMYDGTPAEFMIEYRVTLPETVFGVHESCRRFGIRVVEKTEGNLSGFFFLRCEEADGLLYINILKPLDRTFVLAQTSRQLVETQHQPVIRVRLPQYQVFRRAVVGTMQIQDLKNHFETYEVIYEPSGVLHWFYSDFGLSPGVVWYHQDNPGFNSQEIVFTAKGVVGFRFGSGLVDASVGGSATLISGTLSPSGLTPARWFDFDPKLGVHLPLGDDASTVSLFGGWYEWMMFVSGRSYTFDPVMGPELVFAFEHRHPGELGWNAYLKYAPLATVGNLASLVSGGNNMFSVGAAHDLRLFGERRRRPTLALDISTLHFKNGGNEMTYTSVLLGLTYPLF